MKKSLVLVLGLLVCAVSGASTLETFSFKIRTHLVWCQVSTPCTASSKDPKCKGWSSLPAESSVASKVSLGTDTNYMFDVQPFAEIPFSTGLSLIMENASDCHVFDDVFKTRPDIDAVGTMVTTKSYRREANYCAEDTYKDLKITLAGKFVLSGHRTESRRAPDGLCAP